jgi:hypothetical protein
MMIQEGCKKDEMTSSLLDMITAHEIKEQLSKITDWLKQHYHVDGIGFLFEDNGLTRSYFFTETVTKDIVQNLEETLPRAYQTKATAKDVLLFGLKEGKLSFFSLQEDFASLEPMGLTRPPFALCVTRSFSRSTKSTSSSSSMITLE